MRTVGVVVRDVLVHDPTEVPFIQYDQMIQTLTPDGTDYPFDVCILFRTVWRRPNFRNPHAFCASPEFQTIDAVIVAQDESVVAAAQGIDGWWYHSWDPSYKDKPVRKP